jgi:seryl-tRNA synthetase
MLDPAFIRERPDEVAARLATRGAGFDGELKLFLESDGRRRAALTQVEHVRRQQKDVSGQVGKLKKEGQDTAELQERGRKLGETTRELEAQVAGAEEERDRALKGLPNLPHASVPLGRSAEENQEVRRHGEPRAFDFRPQAHWDLGPALGVLDFERAIKIAGARFSIVQGAGATMARALINFMLDLHVGERGYTEISPPALANSATLTSTGHLPKFEADLFKIAGDWDLYLIPTGEVPLTGLHRDEFLDGRTLPRKYTAYTPCFRSEAGSYGRDVRGMIRQHQFDKVELVKITTPEQSYDELESMTADAEEVLKRLGLPFRTVLLCTGDMGFASAKTYDIEVWLPSQNEYKEISSCSNTEAFQARRANIKFRPDGTGKAEFVHTLNGSALAVGRTLVAILENYQQRDGSVAVPEALRPYMRGRDTIEPARM